jgi:hypothetical protein
MPVSERSDQRRTEQAKVIIDAARCRVSVKGSEFTLHELVKEAGVALQTLERIGSGSFASPLWVVRWNRPIDARGNRINWTREGFQPREDRTGSASGLE